MTAPPFPGFRPAALTFFRGLKRNNSKSWFEENRQVYEAEVKHPMLLLIEEIDARLGEVAPEIVGHPKRSMFRLHRDIRFSKDKSPYKTNAAVWFYHRDAGHGVGGQTAHGGAGLYFQLAPNDTFIGGGIWMPPSPTLKRLREVIAEDHETLEEIVTAPAFRRVFGTLDDSAMLTRPPRGFTPDHPAAQWLRYKSFVASAPMTVAEVQSPKLPDLIVKRYTAMLPFVRWLNTALGLRPQSRR
ncbi:MAG TPA: DUF2461 domain-containing protein [Gemmatimonadaceae bacterium]|jgi:uncharacterized protein (TIGR02453 family)|nr:DUF2461 domain-containing protein [Gemmatimonadaceae bacterium]